jgi:surface carbohydrate biosynthesis protein (TIGR04326 family)
MEAAAAIRDRLAARVRPAAAVNDRGATVLLIAPVTAAALSPGSTPYRDTYFGSLPAFLRDRGERPLLIGLPIADRRNTIRALSRRDDIPAASIAHYLRFRDIAAAAWQAARARLDCAGVRLPDGRDAAPVLRRAFASERGAMMYGALVERATRRALVRHPWARVMHTYENNPWERAVDHAAHGAAPRRDVTGYLHCAVLPSHLKNYIAPEETSLRPAPDRIVCMGPAAREIFLRLGDHDPARVLPGCALRGPTFAELARRAAPPRPVRTALVVLEGLPSMTALLRFLARALPHLSGRRILLRPHPVMPLSVLLPGSGVRLDAASGLDESRAPTLEAAIEEADAVIYQSSTAAMTALAMGVPLIKVRLDGTLEDDPLLDCNALKRVVSRPEDLPSAFGIFETMRQEIFDSEFARAREYLDRLMTPADDRTMAPFLRPASATAAVAARG